MLGIFEFIEKEWIGRTVIFKNRGDGEIMAGNDPLDYLGVDKEYEVVDCDVTDRFTIIRLKGYEGKEFMSQFFDIVTVDYKQKYEELRNCIVDMAQTSIGSFGIANSNGADKYRCPVCHSVKTVKGFADVMGSSIDEVDHKPDCELNNLYIRLVKEIVG